jgi:hypothetical protein
MAKVYAARIKKNVMKAMKLRPTQELAYRMMKERFDKAHRELMKDFERHPVTKEIESGPSAENTSGSLGGYGNLFSFIGFSSTDRPAQEVRDFLNFRPKIFKRSRMIRGANSVSFAFRMQMPTTDEVENRAPSPWGGRSWVRGIERGISGLGYFLYSSKGVGGSRSGTGVQTENRIRNLVYRPTKYMSYILRIFRKKVVS